MNRIALKQFAIRARSLLLQETTEVCARLWFDRLTALRFMELNGFLPDDIRLFRDAAGIPQPQALQTACAALGSIPSLAPLFADNVPMPDTLFGQNGITADLAQSIPEKDWLSHPEMTGWLHQYWNTEEKEQIFADLRNHVKISAEHIPVATQMFTPSWIVRYLAENAIGHLWCGCRPGFCVPPHWRYFLPEVPQPPQAEQVLRQRRTNLNGRALSSLTVMDPCVGTGHMLADAFDVLMDLYLAEGYDAADAAALILQYNLYGLDIDQNACRLACFVLLMKAARYDQNILYREIMPNIHHFSDIPAEGAFTDASMLGSLLCPPADHAAYTPQQQVLAVLLNRQYDAVITNPPYMGSSSMNPVLREFVRRQYPDSKSDLFAVFMERCAAMTAKNGCFAMITQHAWMFLSSYGALRRKMTNYTLRSLVHLGAKAFSVTDVGTIVRTAAFVCLGEHVPDYRTTYLGLSETEDKETAFFEDDKRFVCDIHRFETIPAEPLCYWISDSMRSALQHPKLSAYCKLCQGMTTSDNRRFLRFWYEVPKADIAFGCANAAEAMASGKRWFPYNKGGKLRKWYGNNLYVVNYYRNGEEMRAFHAELNRTRAGGRIKNADMFFRPAVTWPFITEVTKFGVRRQPQGFLFDVSGSSLFPEETDCYYLMGFLSSKAALEMMKLYNPTMNFQVENVGNLPIIFDRTVKAEVERLVQENIALAKEDWDSFELSWDFHTHPLLRCMRDSGRLSDAFAVWEAECESRFVRMQKNEERVNRIFLQCYGLEAELSPDVKPQDITLHHADVGRDIRSLLCFAVGCLFGRYDTGSMSAAVLPLQGNANAASMLEALFRQLWGEACLEENLRYIADALDGGANARSVIGRYLSSQFYTDHCRIYRKRPVYWLADSGRRHGFRALVYAHHMQADTLQQLASAADTQAERYREELLSMAGNSAKAVNLREKAAETEAFAARCRQLIADGACFDPNAGIPANHARFGSILAGIRGQ